MNGLADSIKPRLARFAAFAYRSLLLTFLFLSLLRLDCGGFNDFVVLLVLAAPWVVWTVQRKLRG